MVCHMPAASRPTNRGPAHVVVVGAINVDLVIEAERLPRPGETVVGAGVQHHGGGKGANAAVAAARAGASVRLIGAVGADDTGTAALAELRAVGIDVTDVAVLAGTPTGVALIVVDPHGENQIAVGAGANAALSVAHVTTALGRALPDAGCVLVSTEIPGDAVAAAIAAAVAAGVSCILNPAPVIPVVSELLTLRPVLTPNRTELAGIADALNLTDASRDESPLDAQARELSARTGAPVIVTLGADGALLVADGVAERIPSPPAVVRDTTGAGDTFNGVLAAHLAAGDDLKAAVRAAVAAASRSVTQPGARSSPTQ